MTTHAFSARRRTTDPDSPRRSGPRRAGPRRTLLTAAAVAALVVGPALGASAHVRVVPDSTAAGGWTVLTFRVPNESATASTTQVSVDLPTDTPLTSVSTRPLPGWTASVDVEELPAPVDQNGATITRAPVRVVWTADDGSGIGDGQFQEFEVSAGPLPEAGTELVLAAHQSYSDGSVVDWDQVADGGEEPEHPAPSFVTTDADDADDATGTAGATDASTGTSSTAGAGTQAGKPVTGGDTLARVLGGAGLLTGLLSLASLTVIRRRAAGEERSSRG